MTIDVFWRITTHGEPSSHRSRRPYRGDWFPGDDNRREAGLAGGGEDGFNQIDYLAECARAAEISGFQGGLLPSFPMTDEPWAISAFLARETRTFRFMIAFQPGFLNPVTAARMTASLQRATGGRTLYNIITGGGGPSQLWWGDSVGHDDRYGRTTEFLDVLRGVWKGGGSFTHRGKFFQVEDAGLPDPLSRESFPEIYFSGSSDAALVSAARHADYYLSWLEPTAALADKFSRVKERTAQLGRRIKCAVRVDIVARPTEAEAWREVRRGFENADPALVAKFKGGPGSSDSVGAARQSNLRPTTLNSYKDLIIEPNVWSGFTLLRGGQTNGIVGSYEQVAEKLDQLVQLGADSFILASTPHLEEAYRVGEEVLPLVRGKTNTAALRAVR